VPKQAAELVLEVVIRIDKALGLEKDGRDLDAREELV
jgi:hypothetical protein